MPIPKPNANESQDAFIERCHVALAGEYPETDERNAVCFESWRSSKADEVDKLAQRIFPAEKYDIVRDIPVFCEHDTVDREGQPQHYDKEALKAICDRMNHRILDRKLFPALCDGHTPEDHDAPQPPVKGFAGSYKLGKIGNVDPVWAIFHDEYRPRGEGEYFATHPRRSVEIWLHPEMEKRFWDPVACLGAEAPRLDLPMAFSQSASGLEVAKYSAAYPSATNTFVPKSSEKERYMYSPEEMKELAEALAPQLIPQLITAIAPVVTQAIQQTMAPPPAAPIPAAPPAPAEEPPADDMAMEETPPEPPADDEAAAEEPTDDFEAGGEPDDEEDQFETYAAGEDGGDPQAEGMPPAASDEEPEKMSGTHSNIELAKYQRRVNDLEKRLAAQDAKFKKLENERRQSERYARFCELELQGFDLGAGKVTVKENGKDVEKDLYGAAYAYHEARSMSDAEFERHVATIVKYARREESAPFDTFPIEAPQNGGQPMTPDAVAQAVTEATARTQRYRKEGKNVGYGDVLKEVYSERGITRDVPRSYNEPVSRQRVG